MEGKAMKGWTPQGERALASMLEQIGGPLDTQLDGEPLNASEGTFDHGLDLVRGRVEPSPGEREAVERFKQRTNR